MIDGIFSNSERELLDALNKVQNYVRLFYEDAGSSKKYDIRYHGTMMCWVMAKACADLSHLPQPSLFKKAGQFTLHFVLNNPITTELPDEWYLPEISRLNVQNSILAFEICRRSFCGAVIHGNDGEDKPLEIEIRPSKHQYTDIIKTFATIQPVPAAYDTYSRMIALIYESLAYEFNPECRYKPTVETGTSVTKSTSKIEAVVKNPSAAAK